MATILVISNHFSSRIAYTAALSGYGYQVTEAQSIKEAQMMLSSGFAPQAVIVDVKYTPAIQDALQSAYAEFEALYPSGERPTLIVIGGLENAHMIESMADLFLPRPVELYDLINQVQQWVAA